MNAQKIAEELRKKAYLKGKTLVFARFEPKFPDDHTFCVFCWARISGWEEDLHDGYLEEESQSWVCDICIEEFEKPFEWIAEKASDQAWQRLLQKNTFDIPLL